MFSKTYPENRIYRKRASRRQNIDLLSEFIPINLNALAEGEGISSTLLGRSKSEKQKKLGNKIDCLKFVKESLWGSLNGLKTTQKEININLKNAPNNVPLLFNKHKKKEVTMERNSYSTYIIGRGKEYPFEFKYNAVSAAQELGIKPSAKRFKISRNALRSWLRRFNMKGKKGLKDMRAGPKRIPHKISADEEERIVSIRKKIPCFGPQRIKYHFGIKSSIGTIYRVLKSHELTRKRRKVTQKRRDLRAVKAKMASMTKLQMDVKYLTDIPCYWEQLKPLGLPKFQYTIRDTKSGMLFLGYSDELSGLNACTMIDYVLDEMKDDLPFEINKLTVQTDNGSEFSGQARRIETNPFKQMVEQVHGAKQQYIRPGHCNAQADVESSHYLIETEFFDLTQFKNREDFFRKIESYRLYFNFTRPNFSKGTKTPQEICANDWNLATSYNYSLIKTLDLDTISNYSYQRGQTIPDFAETAHFTGVEI